MSEMFFFRKQLPNMIDLAGIGLVADKRSGVELILKDTLDSGMLP